MMNLKTILHKDDAEDYTELVEEAEEVGKIGVIVDRIEAFTDADRIVRSLREGKLIFAKLGQFKHTNIDELRRTISKIKQVCSAIDGEIISVANEWLIVAPPSTKVMK